MEGAALGCGHGSAAAHVPWRKTSRVGCFPRSTFHVRTFQTLEVGTRPWRGQRSGAGTVPLQPTFRGARPQGSVVSHVLRSMFHVLTFQTLEVGTRPWRGQRSGAGTVPPQPTFRGARPQGSVVSHVLRSTFARSHVRTFHVPRSHVRMFHVRTFHIYVVWRDNAWRSVG